MLTVKYIQKIHSIYSYFHIKLIIMTSLVQTAMKTQSVLSQIGKSPMEDGNTVKGKDTDSLVTAVTSSIFFMIALGGIGSASTYTYEELVLNKMKQNKMQKKIKRARKNRKCVYDYHRFDNKH